MVWVVEQRIGEQGGAVQGVFSSERTALLACRKNLGLLRSGTSWFATYETTVDASDFKVIEVVAIDREGRVSTSDLPTQPPHLLESWERELSQFADEPGTFKRCASLTIAGKKCQAGVTVSDYCVIHETRPIHTPAEAEARQAEMREKKRNRSLENYYGSKPGRRRKEGRPLIVKHWDDIAIGCKGVCREGHVNKGASWANAVEVEVVAVERAPGNLTGGIHAIAVKELVSGKVFRVRPLDGQKRVGMFRSTWKWRSVRLY